MTVEDLNRYLARPSQSVQDNGGLEEVACSDGIVRKPCSLTGEFNH